MNCLLCLPAALVAALLVCLPHRIAAQDADRSFSGRNLREFGLRPGASAEANRDSLQKAIDWATRSGAALFLEPSEEPYAVAAGVVLRRNVSLLGIHGPTGRGTRHPEKPQPVGCVFRIEDETKPFLTVESATQIRGIQFWYPRQTISDPAKIIRYPATIAVSRTEPAQGVTLSQLTFYGEYLAMDFTATRELPCEQILMEHCYGYPLSGAFIRITHCYDIPRILHCHVNPSNQRFFRGGFSRAVVDAVVAAGTFTYSIDHTDNAVLMDVFAFGAHGGVRLGPASYGQLTSFNLDCVTVGIHKSGDGAFNRNWQISQGSIIANTGARAEDIHPLIIDGEGHTSISNVEAFAGPNEALTTRSQSHDFLLIRGGKRLTVSLSNCRMRNYKAASPVTIENPEAIVQASGCIAHDELPWLVPPQRAR